VNPKFKIGVVDESNGKPEMENGKIPELSNYERNISLRVDTESVVRNWGASTGEWTTCLR
jgi:hypothetical protein